MRAVDGWEECVRGADVVVEASRLSEPEPLLRTSWISRGALVIRTERSARSSSTWWMTLLPGTAGSITRFTEPSPSFAGAVVEPGDACGRVPGWC